MKVSTWTSWFPLSQEPYVWFFILPCYPCFFKTTRAEEGAGDLFSCFKIRCSCAGQWIFVADLWDVLLLGPFSCAQTQLWKDLYALWSVWIMYTYISVPLKTMLTMFFICFLIFLLLLLVVFRERKGTTQTHGIMFTWECSTILH